MFFRQKYIEDMFIDSVFDGDYEFDIIFIEICTKKMKIVKYEALWSIARNVQIISYPIAVVWPIDYIP